MQKKEVATHILAFSICGIFVRLEYTLAQFPTTGNKMAIHYFYQVCLAIPGQELYDIIWSTIRKLKEIGLNAVVVVSDGMCTNRRFFKLHRHEDGMKNGLVYRVKNIYDPSRYVCSVYTCIMYV